MFDLQNPLFLDPNIEYPINDLDLSFRDYIKKTKYIIEKNRQDIHPHNQFIVDVNAPYELIPTQSKPKKGILLIHGLFDSPFIMRDIGNHFQQKGYLVRSILLPGHGLVPGALLNTDYQDWLQAVRYGVASLIKDVEEIYLIGFSTGASLAHYYAAEDSSIKGVVMLAPAFKIRSNFDWLSEFFFKFGKLIPRAAWFHIENERDYAKYLSVTYNSIYQVYRLAKKTKTLHRPRCPLFIAIVEDDKIVSSKNALLIFSNDKHPDSKLIFYSKNKKNFNDGRICWRSTIYPEYKIENFSHLSLPISPKNNHYGINGDYFKNLPKENICYGSLDRLEEDINLILYKLKIKKSFMQRLRFNPDFDFLMSQIETFCY